MCIYLCPKRHTKHQEIYIQILIFENHAQRILVCVCIIIMRQGNYLYFSGNPNTLFRGNSLATKSVDQFMKVSLTSYYLFHSYWYNTWCIINKHIIDNMASSVYMCFISFYSTTRNLYYGRCKKVDFIILMSNLQTLFSDLNSDPGCFFQEFMLAWLICKMDVSTPSAWD
jgi:hypothetical protein